MITMGEKQAVVFRHPALKTNLNRLHNHQWMFAFKIYIRCFLFRLFPVFCATLICVRPERSISTGHHAL